MMDEQEAITQIKCGDITALEVLVHIHQSRAIRIVYLITRDRGLAEDIVQSAFIRAFERIGQLQSGRPFGPWFLRSVVNDANKATRRARRLVPLRDDDERTSEVNRTHNGILSPHEIAENSETSAELWVALGTLPFPQRTVIVLHYYAGLSEGEIAEHLHIPRGTVKWRLHAARRRLRACLVATIGITTTMKERSTS